MVTQSARKLQIEQVGDVAIIRWDDQPHWPTEGDALLHEVEKAGRRKVLVNFANVDALSSIVLAKLILLNKKLQAGGGTLVICGVSPRVREVFEITRVNEFLGFQPGEAEALQALA